jgi:penicillin amidase/acyl-homoserine-lactone acylase
MPRAWWAAAACAAALVTLVMPPAPRRADPARLLPPPGRYDVRILRDSWGVPHVFGRTDADVAYGLAFAHAEDDFTTIQGALLAARGRLATVRGPDGAPNDFMVQLLRVNDVVDAGYARDLSPATRAVCEAYADGLNHYAALHPDRAWAGLFPARGRDVVAGFVHKLPLFFGLDRVLKNLLSEDEAAPPLAGSNAFAIAPSRSADGATRLVVNSHQPWTGPVAWYEAHLHSEEGWDAVGGVFPGAPVILHGHNRRLGWAHTVNDPDLIDVYALTIDPNDPNRYRFDGAWRAFEQRTASIDVKLWGPLRWTVQRAVPWSVHGPVVRGPRGTFAVRLAGYGEVRQVEQWYRMNKARSWDEWRDAMRMQALPMFNCAYADADGHIAYVYNAKVPKRAAGYDWRHPVPGDTSATLWTETLPFDALPMVVDPPSGFVQTTNSTPFSATTGAGNPDPAAFDATLGIETHLTNRGRRALALLGADESITSDELDAIKWDVGYAPDSEAAQAIDALLAAPPPRDPLTLEALALLATWDRRADAGNRATALAILTLDVDSHGRILVDPPELLFDRLRDAAGALKKHFGRLDVPWGEVNRLRHGSADLPLSGAPDVLRAVYAKEDADGRWHGTAGDSYVLIAEWDRAGQVRSRSIHQFGSATLDKTSRHYADQAPLFAQQRLKPVWLDEAEIRAHLEREYHPGE